MVQEVRPRVGLQRRLPGRIEVFKRQGRAPAPSAAPGCRDQLAQARTVEGADPQSGISHGKGVSETGGAGHVRPRAVRRRHGHACTGHVVLGEDALPKADSVTGSRPLARRHDERHLIRQATDQRQPVDHGGAREPDPAVGVASHRRNRAVHVVEPRLREPIESRREPVQAAVGVTGQTGPAAALHPVPHLVCGQNCGARLLQGEHDRQVRIGSKEAWHGLDAAVGGSRREPVTPSWG